MPPKHEITRERILTSALEIIKCDGLEALSARAVANRLKCSTQPVYCAFGSMESLKSAAYESALQLALEAIRDFRDDRYPPALCPAIAYLRLAHDERQLFRSVYLSGYSASHAKGNLLIGEEMIASHVPDSSRLRNAGISQLKRIYTKISIYIAGLGAMVNTGALDYSVESAADMVTDIYETVVTGELASGNREKPGPPVELGPRIGSGANADVFLFGEGKVVKLFRDKNQLQNLYRERRNHLFIQQSGLPVPRVYEPVDIGSLPGLVYEHIEGPTVVERLFTKDGADDIRMLARLLHRIHTVPVQRLDCRHMPRVNDVLRWQINRGVGLSGAEKTGVLDVLAALPERNCLCHGDLNPLNVIIRDGSPVMIDWQGASIGSPEYDVMQLMLIWKYAVVPPSLAPNEFIREFYQHREEINRDFLDEYMALSGITAREIDAWLVPVAAAKLSNDICDGERAALLQAVRTGLASSGSMRV